MQRYSLTRGVFVFLLTIALLYFAITFALYYYIDIRNLEKTPHEQGLQKVYYDRWLRFSQKYVAKLRPLIQKALPEHHHLRAGGDGISHILEDVVKGGSWSGILLQPRYDLSKIRIFRAVEQGRSSNYIDIELANEPEPQKQIDEIIRKQLRFFWWHAKLNRVRRNREW